MDMDIYNDIEDALRNMAMGKSYGAWSENTVKKIYPFVRQIIEDDLANQREDQEKAIGRLAVDEDMVTTAMMMALV